MLKRSAVRNGERTAFSRSSISARSATGSSAASRSRRYAASMPPSIGSEPQSPDGHAYRRFSACAFPWPAPATPNTLRTRIETHGTLAWYDAYSARVPRRMVPRRSASVPITNPGWSTKFTTGSRNWSQRSTNRIISSDAPALGPPAEKRGADAIAPTARPPRRAGHAPSQRPKLRPVAHDPGEVRRHRPGRAEARHRPQRRRGDAHERQVLHGQVPARHERHVREAHRLERLHAAAPARAVHEAHQRHAEVVRH